MNFVSKFLNSPEWTRLLVDFNLNVNETVKNVSKLLKNNFEIKKKLFDDFNIENLKQNVGQSTTEITNHNLHLLVDLFNYEFRKNVKIEYCLTMDYLSRDYEFFSTDAFDPDCPLNQQSRKKFMMESEQNKSVKSFVSKKCHDLQKRILQFLKESRLYSEELGVHNRFICFFTLCKHHYWLYVVDCDELTIHVMNSMDSYNNQSLSQIEKININTQRNYKTLCNMYVDSDKRLKLQKPVISENEQDFQFQESVGESLSKTLLIAKDYYGLKDQNKISFHRIDESLQWFFKTYFKTEFKLINDFRNQQNDIQNNASDCGVFSLMFYFIQFFLTQTQSVQPETSQLDKTSEQRSYVKDLQIIPEREAPACISNKKITSEKIAQSIKQCHVDAFRQFLIDTIDFYTQNKNL